MNHPIYKADNFKSLIFSPILPVVVPFGGRTAHELIRFLQISPSADGNRSSQVRLLIERCTSLVSLSRLTAG